MLVNHWLILYKFVLPFMDPVIKRSSNNYHVSTTSP